MLCQLSSSWSFRGPQCLNHAPTHTMLHTTRLVSWVQQTTEDTTIPPTRSTQVLTLMSATFHHTNQIQILKMFSIASLAVISPFSPPLATASHTTMLPCLNFMWPHCFQAQHWQMTEEPHQPQQLAQLWYGCSSAHWIHLVQNRVLWMWKWIFRLQKIQAFLEKLTNHWIFKKRSIPRAWLVRL